MPVDGRFVARFAAKPTRETMTCPLKSTGSGSILKIGAPDFGDVLLSPLPFVFLVEAHGVRLVERLQDLVVDDGKIGKERTSRTIVVRHETATMARHPATEARRHGPSGGPGSLMKREQNLRGLAAVERPEGQEVDRPHMRLIQTR